MKKYLPVLVAIGVVAARSAFAQGIPSGGIDTFTQDIWTFAIESVGLMVIGLAIIGALIGAMVADTGRGVARAITGAAIGAFLAGVPALSEYVISLGEA